MKARFEYLEEPEVIYHQAYIDSDQVKKKFKKLVENTTHKINRFKLKQAKEHQVREQKIDFNSRFRNKRDLKKKKKALNKFHAFEEESITEDESGEKRSKVFQFKLKR